MCPTILKQISILLNTGNKFLTSISKQFQTNTESSHVAKIVVLCSFHTLKLNKLRAKENMIVGETHFENSVLQQTLT